MMAADRALTLIGCAVPLPRDGLRSDPAVLVPRQVGEISPAGPIVNQIDDECPHDRTPLFDRRGG